MKKHIYRKLSLSMAMLLTSCLSFGSAMAEPAEPTLKAWYEISEDIVIIELPADNTGGYEWDYEISDPEMLEVLSVEYTVREAPEEKEIPEETEPTEETEPVEEADPIEETEKPADEINAFENVFDSEAKHEMPGETYVASFQVPEGQSGEVTLTLSYHGETEGEAPLRVCSLQLNIAEDGAIEVVSAERNNNEVIEEPAAESAE